MAFFTKMKKILIILMVVVALLSCDDTFRPIRKSDLNGHVVGVLGGSFQEMSARKELKGAYLRSFPSNKELIEGLVAGDCEAVYVDQFVTLNPAFNKYNVRVAFNDKDRMPIAGALRKDDVEMQKRFNKYLRDIKANGLYVNMKNYWMNTSRPDTMPRRVIPVPKGVVLRGTLRVGIDGELIPLSMYRNGEWVGLERENWERFAATIGKKVEFVVYDFNDLIPALEKGEIDAIASSMTVTDERAQRVLFTDPYATSNSVCLVRK